MAVTKLQDSGGTIGLDEEGYSSFNAEQIAINLSRTQYRKNLKAKGEITGVYEAAMNYVRPMSVSQKQRMLASYGDASQLPRNATVEQLNAQLVETLIIRLTDKELKNLINKSNSANKKLLNELDGASKGSSTFSLNTLSEISYNKNTVSEKEKLDMYKKIQQLDPNFLTHKIFSDKTYGFNGLIREIDRLLHALTPIELAKEAITLGIPFESAVDKDVRKTIAYRCCAYLALVTGKAKTNEIHGVYGGAIADEYEKLINETTYRIYLNKSAVNTARFLKYNKQSKLEYDDNANVDNATLKQVKRRNRKMSKISGIEFTKAESQLFGKNKFTQILGRVIKPLGTFIKWKNTRKEFADANEFIKVCGGMLGIDENVNNSKNGDAKNIIYRDYAFSDAVYAALQLTYNYIPEHADSLVDSSVLNSIAAKYPELLENALGVWNMATMDVWENGKPTRNFAEVVDMLSKLFMINIDKKYMEKIADITALTSQKMTLKDAATGAIKLQFKEFQKAQNPKDKIKSIQELAPPFFSKVFLYYLKVFLSGLLRNTSPKGAHYFSDIDKFTAKRLVAEYIKLIAAERSKKLAESGLMMRDQVSKSVRKKVGNMLGMFGRNITGKVEDEKKAEIVAMNELKKQYQQTQVEDDDEYTYTTNENGEIVRTKKNGVGVAQAVIIANNNVSVKNGIIEAGENGEMHNVLAVAIAGYTQDAINAFKGINQDSSSSTESTDKIPNIFKKVLTDNQIASLETIADQDVSDFANGVGTLYSKVIDKTNEKIDKHTNALTKHENERKNYDVLTDEAKKAMDAANAALPPDDKNGKYGDCGGKNKVRPVNRFYRTLYDEDYWSKYSRLYFKGDIWMNSNVTPAFILNNYDKTYSSMLEQLENTADNTSSIAEFLTDTLPIMWMTLQQVGLSTNAASAGGASAKAVSIVNTIADTALSKLKKHARGAVISGGTSFISGDTLTGRPNPEMVNVNWADHTVSVKPVTFKNNVPHFATGGTNTTEKTERLSTSERVAPLNVAVASGLVKYSSKELIGATDDGTNTAIKVYNMNSPLTETVVYEGTEITLVDILYGLGTGITNIGNILTNQTSILSTIANNTANSNNTTVVESSSSGFTFPTNLDSILKGE